MSVKNYRGACHCESVVYEVSADISTVISCNCSICSKKGHLLAFTGAEQFKLLKGENVLGEYRFNKKVIAHMFCKNCGVGTFGRGTGRDGKAMVALNVRCLDNVDLNTLTINQVDGKSF